MINRFSLLAVVFVLTINWLYAAKNRVGLLVAVEIESVVSKYGHPVNKEFAGGFEVLRYKNKYYELCVVNSGVGEIAAAAATQMLIDVYDVKMVVNFGVVGGLTEEMSLAKTCIVEKAVHYDFDLSQLDSVAIGQYPNFMDIYLYPDKTLIEKALSICPYLKKVTCASGDKFVSLPEEKFKLHRDFGADICEMESAAIILTCNRNKIPCLLIKAVSDSLVGGGGEFYSELKKTSDICFFVTDKLIKEMKL